ncbi:hypothetical protein IJT10_05825 [bacterium]|nr:hypothetical protein [bacterium]
MERFGFPWEMSKEEYDSFEPKTANMSMSETIDYLYRYMVDLLEVSEDDPKVKKLKEGFEKIKKECEEEEKDKLQL